MTQTGPQTGAQLQGPVYSNFTPKRRLISGISTAAQAVVTTTEDHEYDDTIVVRVDVPLAYGMGQALYVQTGITVLSPTTFRTQLDSTVLNAFAAPSFPPAFTAAQVIPMTGTTDNIASW